MHNINHKAIIRRLAASSAILLGVIASLVCWSRSGQVFSNYAQIHLLNSTIDLGGVQPFETREVAFSIENKGQRRVVLNEIRCGCGEPVRKAILVPPGKTEEVLISLETGLESGTIEKKVSFSTNDAARPRIDLTVVAWVIEK